MSNKNRDWLRQFYVVNPLMMIDTRMMGLMYLWAWVQDVVDTFMKWWGV